MGLALPWALLAPLPAMGFSALIAGTAFSQRRRLGRMLGKIEATEPLRLSAGPEGLQLAIGPALPVPLHDAWRIGPVDVLYPAAGAPQLLWPDSLLPADRARMRALMTLHPCSSR
ncbi:MAG: hypothetical protein MUE46_05070 [Xanthomonadales bacterium]|nr:hypothetical protein [Xanthomonadales bacterium]